MIRCPYCQSTNVQKRGFNRNGEMQRARCFNCKENGESGWFSVPIKDTYIPTSEYERSNDEIKEVLSKYDKFIISSVQVNTKIHKDFWNSIKQYAFHNRAGIILRPVYYLWHNDKSRREFDGAVEEYIVENDIQLHEGLSVMNVQVTATAVNPLSGLESLTGKQSTIIGHPQIQLKTIATPQATMPKIMTTTGSISEKNNYSPSKAGKKGAFHHSLGAVVVELDGPIFHIRNVTGDRKGEFYDLNYKYTPEGREKIDRVEALVTGDEHQWWMSEDVAKATYLNRDSIVNVLRPKKIVRHDIADSFSVSHWHRSDVITRYLKKVREQSSLYQELFDAANFLNLSTPGDTENIIVASNHHEHVTRWLNETDWRNDLQNARIYHEMWAAILDAADTGLRLDPFIWWMEQHVDVPTKWLSRRDKVMICGIMVNMHGDVGPNGAKGSINNLKNLGVKTIIGHLHTPGIDKGAYQVGTSTIFDIPYTKGPSSWLNTHAIIHDNGKRQLIHVIRGKWKR